jgi:alpha-L-arabinofuranosidase
VDIDLGGTKLAVTAKLVTLSAPDPRATNTIDHPDQLVLVETRLQNVSSKVHHVMPPYSIQAIEFEQQ